MQQATSGEHDAEASLSGEAKLQKSLFITLCAGFLF